LAKPFHFLPNSIRRSAFYACRFLQSADALNRRVTRLDSATTVVVA
jgi:hypothetical protein